MKKSDLDRPTVLHILGEVKESGKFEYDDVRVVGHIEEKVSEWIPRISKRNPSPAFIDEQTVRSGCFKGSAKVYTPKGLVRIDHISEGDKVFCYSEETREYLISKVLKVKKKEGVEFAPIKLLDIGIDDDYPEILECSAEHPFFLEVGGEIGIVKAADMGKGDHVIGFMDHDFTVEEPWDKTKITVSTGYDLQVETFKNYFVNGVLVHNKILA